MSDGQARFRSFDSRVPITGTYEDPYYGIRAEALMSVGDSGTCDDVVNAYQQVNPLDLKRYTRRYPTLDGEWSDSLGRKRIVFKTFPIDYRPPDPEGTFPSDWVNPDLIAIAHSIAGRSNPGKPEFNVPRALGELLDLTETGLSLVDLFTTITGRIKKRGLLLLRFLELRRQSGKIADKFLSSQGGMSNVASKFSGGILKDSIPSLPKDAASAHILWKFGIQPMISDLRKLTSLQQFASRRIQKLQKLASRPLSKTVELGEESYIESQEENFTVHSLGVRLRATKTVRLKRKHWGHVKWAPLLADVLAPGCPAGSWGGHNAFLNANRDSLGFNEYGAIAAAWELIPWSWLGSWFANYGAWLDANNYTIPVNPYDMCYMMTLEKETKIVFPDSERLAHPWLTITGDYLLRETRKYRIPIDKSLLWIPPLTSLSCLNGGSLSILGSLLTLDAYRSDFLKTGKF